MTEQRLKYLLNAYLDNRLTPVEQEEWVNAFQDAELRETLNQLIDETYHETSEDELTGLPASKKEEVFQHIIGQQPAKVPTIRKSTRWARIAIAASILMAIGAGSYYALQKQKPEQVAVHQPAKIELLPGTNAATLTLANGQQIPLTKTMSGQLAVQGKTKVQMNNDGSITYNGNTSETLYNTLATKRKQQFPIVLADGTEVMLDAESSITYPVTFNGKERKVKVTGQAYFKVFHNEQQPFVVEAKGQTIRDIGTEFNVNAYDDEPVVKTTLIEGFVTVNDHSMKPGQTAESNDNQLSIKAGDIEEATAWKNGLFHFNGTDLQPLMRQLSRWYDVDVTYQGTIPKFEFGGDMTRNVKASKVFEMLEKYGLNVKVDGKHVTISAK